MSAVILAKDLRAGNIHESHDFSIPRLGLASVKVDGKPYSKITTWGIHLVDQGELEFVPIRITPDWMKLFGFVRANTIEEIYAKQGFSTVLCVDGKYYIRGVKNPIEFVHIFQNVYYYLENEELIINHDLHG